MNTAPQLARPQLARPPLTWNMVGRSLTDLAVTTRWPWAVTPDFAWGGATGRGARVCILDSGVEDGHPVVGPVQASYTVREQPGGSCEVVPAEPGDLSGHGTACAGIVRSVAPECEIHSVQVLSHGMAGSGEALLAGLRWAVAEGFDVINMSISTTRHKFVDTLRTLTDEAYFHRSVLVASAHNMPVESFPWRFSSVVSVGSHDTGDPGQFFYNPSPPVEFFAHGVNVEVAWLGGGTRRCTGNSFATPHIAGYCALILGKNPGLTAFQVKNLLYLTAANVRGEPLSSGVRLLSSEPPTWRRAPSRRSAVRAPGQQLVWVPAAKCSHHALPAGGGRAQADSLACPSGNAPRDRGP